MGLWKGVCLLCQKCTLVCLLFKLLKVSLYLVLNEKFQYDDLEAPRCLSYPLVRPSARYRDNLRKIVSNTVISKLCGVCRTQSCDPPHDLEIIWGLKMSKLLNLIAYSLHVYSLVQTEFLVAYVRAWQITRLELLLVTFIWYLSCLYTLALLEIKVLMLVVTLLKLLHHLISFLGPYYIFVIY
jgi:hypothetical protein